MKGLGGRRARKRATRQVTSGRERIHIAGSESADESVVARSERRRQRGGARSRGKSFDEHVAQALEEKPLAQIIRNLELAFGEPQPRQWGDPLATLINVILSQATSDTNSDRAFAALKRRFPRWEDLLSARLSTIAAAIRIGGLANQKAVVIRDLLRQLKEERGSLDLSFLCALPTQEAAAYLAQFRGIGPKTIACTLLFACGKEIFPIDTHIFRVLRRLGLLPERCSPARAHAVMDRVVPSGKFYSFHINLIRLGRTICRPRQPRCERCPIVEYCDYGQSRI
ncbi:MAG: Fe-S cluster assembly protein HesB [Pyrinomonas sp.]